MKYFFAFLLIIFSYSVVCGQDRLIFSGKILDEEGVPLPSASIIISAGSFRSGTVSDALGLFSFNLESAGDYFIQISFNGFKPLAINMQLDGSDTLYIFTLFHTTMLLDEVLVEDRLMAMRKREESLQIHVADQQFMRDHNSGSLMQTLSRMPGIQSLTIGSGQSKPLIRGLGFNRVVVTQHGIKHQGQQWGSDHALEIDQFAYDHIEMIKGPASLLYGSDGVGGAIRLSQRNVPEKNSLAGTLDLTAKTNNDLWGSSLSLGGRKNRFFLTSRLTWMDYGDYRVPVDSVDVYSYRVPLHQNRLRNTAGNERNIHLSAGWVDGLWATRFFASDISQTSGFFANAHGLEPRRVNTSLYDQSSRDILFPRQEARHLSVINQTRRQWNQWLLLLEAGYQRNRREELAHYTNHGFMPPVFPENMPTPSYLERSFDKQTLSANLQVQTIIAENQFLTLGVSGESQENESGGVNFLMPSYNQTQAGGFALYQWSNARNIILNGGLRYDMGSISTREHYDWFTTQGIYLQRASRLEMMFSDFSGGIGINYHQDNIILKGNLGRSYRMPLANELASNGVNYHHFSFERGDSTLKAEVAYQLDMGFEISSERWEFRTSPFITWFPNYIYLNPGYLFDFNYGAGNQIFDYTGTEVLRAGFEIGFYFKPSATLSIDLLGEYVYSEQLSGGKRGFTLPFSPPASMLSSVSWKPSVFNSTGREILVFVDWRVTAAQNQIVPPERKTPGYQWASIGARGSVKVNETSIQWNFTISNLFNATYYDHTSYYRLIGVPEPGRNINLLISVPFSILSDL